MSSDQALFYLRYMIARIAAYRNVWWSMANEYDIMRRTDEEWEKYFRVIQTCDPYGHLCSIHNGMAWYNHSEPWITHLSIQTAYLQDIQDWRELYKKPVIIDECVYEGNIPNDGEISLPKRWLTGSGYLIAGEHTVHMVRHIFTRRISSGGQREANSTGRVRKE